MAGHEVTLGNRFLIIGWAIGLASVTGSAADSKFDPSGYIEDTEMKEAAKATKLSGKSIFRIDGRRFQKMMSSDGAVYLPSDGSIPEIVQEFAFCQHHIRLMREVIPVRENMPVEPEILKHEAAILGMIRACRDGSIKGPTLVIETPSGAQVEVKAKKDVKKDVIKEKGSSAETK